MSKQEVRNDIGNAEIFSTLSSESIETLANGAQLIRASTGTVLTRAGDESQGIHLVVTGLVKMAFYSLHGQEKVIAMLDAGKSFGQAEMFSGIPFHYDAQALTQSQLVFIPRQSALEVSKTDPAFLEALLVSLGRQFDALVRDIKYSVSYSAPQRVIGFLLSRTNGTNDGSADLELAVTKGALAARLGIAPETLSRTLGFLLQNQFITMNNRQIKVHDVAQLRDLLRKSLREGASLATVYAHKDEATSRPQ